jgi:signal transduction histidine kinase
VSRGRQAKRGKNTPPNKKQRHSHDSARLLEAIGEIASTLDLAALLDRTVEAAKQLTGSQAASLLLYDPETQQLYFEAATKMIAVSLGQVAVPTEHSIAGWVFTHNQPLLVNDTLSDPRSFPEIDVITGSRTSSILGVPLRARGNTLGVIEAINKKGGYDKDDVTLLQTLAVQAAIAIENRRLTQQSDLVADMVHELRTPLAALTAAGHLIQRPDLLEEQRKNVARTMLGEVQRLNQMTSDFLELARLESGRLYLDREPIHLGGLVEECLEIMRPQADDERISLGAVIDADTETVRGDRNRLKQLLLNLLTNAIKYNRPNGFVKVSVSPAGNEAMLAVEDSGRGIPKKYLPKIFDRFYRVPDEDGYPAGTGLGLAIAKRIVENHRGRIDVTSRRGKGSTFTVYLPTGSLPPREPR